MNINYHRLFNITLHHNYFQDDFAKGIHLIAVDRTENLIKNGRMLLKTTPRETVVLFRALEDGLGPLIAIGKDQKFTFGIKVNELQEFMNITDLDENQTKKFDSSNVIYFKNDPAHASSDPDNPEELTHEIIGSLRSRLFTYNFYLDTNPQEVKMEVSDEFGNLDLFTVTIDANGIYSQQVDLREKPSGKYTITIQDTNNGTVLKEDTIFADDQLATQNIIGVLEVVYDATSNHLYGDTEQYALKFSRKHTIWKYFIVDKNRQVDFTDMLSIVDESAGAHEAYEQNTFAMEGDQPHADVRINDLDTVIFNSNGLIPFFEVPKLNLELKNSTGIRILPHLPNPSHSGVIKDIAGQPASEIYVFI